MARSMCLDLTGWIKGLMGVAVLLLISPLDAEAQQIKLRKIAPKKGAPASIPTSTPGAPFDGGNLFFGSNAFIDRREVMTLGSCKKCYSSTALKFVATSSGELSKVRVVGSLTSVKSKSHGFEFEIRELKAKRKYPLIGKTSKQISLMQNSEKILELDFSGVRVEKNKQYLLVLKKSDFKVNSTLSLSIGLLDTPKEKRGNHPGLQLSQVVSVSLNGKLESLQRYPTSGQPVPLFAVRMNSQWVAPSTEATEVTSTAITEEGPEGKKLRLRQSFVVTNENKEISGIWMKIGRDNKTSAPVAIRVYLKGKQKDQMMTVFNLPAAKIPVVADSNSTKDWIYISLDKSWVLKPGSKFALEFSSFGQYHVPVIKEVRSLNPMEKNEKDELSYAESSEDGGLNWASLSHGDLPIVFSLKSRTTAMK